MGIIFRFGFFASLAAVLSAALPFAMTGSAPARPRQGEPAAETAEPVPSKAPLFFVISLSKQQVSMYSPGGLYAKSPVSTGQPGHPTPQGIFTILNKELYHESNIYSGAPMPFMQRITYTGVAMHEGVLPGYPASHGCIRMPHDFAEWLYRATAGNERVVITQQDVVPIEIAHPRLPAPKFMAAGGGTGALNPLEFAKVMKVRAARQAEEAAAAIGPARWAADLKAGEARAAALEYRKAEIAVAAAKNRLEAADGVLKRAATDEATKAATAARDTAETKLNEAKAALEMAMHVKTQREQDVETAARLVREADLNRQYTAGAVKSWNRRFAPLSIFISRKTQRLYVRQDYVPVFDLPIAIRESEKPIGTHLFIAMPKETADGPNQALRWVALTVPEGVPNENDIGARLGGGVNVAALHKIVPPTAQEALDRIEIPKEVAEKLSEMVWAGAALIVSDNEMSRETTDFARTDFVVLTGGQTSHHRAFSASRGERFSPMRRGGSFFDLFR